jgi:hypothetical protein
MNFMAWLSSLDELLYEVMSWILFLPITLWRTLRHPLGMMDYADAELARLDEKTQYQDALSPPLFLTLCLLLGHALSSALGETDALIASNHGMAALVGDQTSALLLRVILFGAFPLFMAARLVRKQGVGLTRGALKPAFYAHCYPAGLLALVMGGGATLLDLQRPGWQLPGLALILLALLAYGTVSAIWFARRLHQPVWRGFVYASFSMVEALALVVVIALLFRP